MMNILDNCQPTRYFCYVSCTNQLLRLLHQLSSSSDTLLNSCFNQLSKSPNLWRRLGIAHILQHNPHVQAPSPQTWARLTLSPPCLWIGVSKRSSQNSNLRPLTLIPLYVSRTNQFTQKSELMEKVSHSTYASAIFKPECRLISMLGNDDRKILYWNVVDSNPSLPI